jgi:hypothetical protein
MHAAGIIQESVLYRGAAVIVIVLSVMGIAAITGMIPGTIAQQDARDVAAGGVLPVVVAELRCENCGVIEDVRTYSGNTVARKIDRDLRYRITVRMQDGTRLLTETSVPDFAVGDHVSVSGSGAIAYARRDRG